jgi:hypothetical protein
VAHNSALLDLQSQDSQLHRSWQVGGFIAGGFAPFYEYRARGVHFHEEIDFFSAGLETGKMLSGLHGPGFLHGRRGGR